MRVGHRYRSSDHLGRARCHGHRASILRSDHSPASRGGVMSVPPVAAPTGDPVVDRLAEIGRSPSLVITEGALGTVVGVAWTVGGVVRMVQGVVAERGTTRGWRIASGALSLLAGAVVLVYPGASLAVLTAVLGVVLIVEGACLIA